MIQSLACLHKQYGLYNNFRINEETWTPKIVEKLSAIEETEYLANAYSDYFKAYRGEYRNPEQSMPSNNHKTSFSKTVDLPYLGSETIRLGKARYFMVFEGSLGNASEPSITVLSCLWAINNYDTKLEILSEYWHGKGIKSFNFIVKSLKMNSSLAKHCYVTDAIKFGDNQDKPDIKKNRELLRKEIDILNPEYVILLGTKAKSTLGNKPLRGTSKVLSLPFPTTNYRSVQMIAEKEKEFQVLNDIWCEL